MISMTENEKLLIQLQDCFTAGYTMPQFCIDNNIKKPLFVAPDESYKTFLWKIYIQFKYDKRFSAKFALIKGEIKDMNFSVSENSVSALTLKNVSKINDEEFDRIIIFTASNSPHPKIIYLQWLTNYFIRRAYYEIPLLHFIEQNPDVKLIACNNPGLIENDFNTPFEKWALNERKKPPVFYGIDDGVEILSTPDSVVHLRNKISLAKVKGETIATPYDVLGYSNEKVYALLETPEQKVNIDGSVSFCDNEFLKIQNGHRVTANQPEKYQNTIYFVGNCVTFGYGVPFDKTLESQLQNLLNENNLPYKVENFALFSARKRQDSFYFLDKIKPRRGDIIFFVCSPSPNIPYLNLSELLKRPHNYGEVFPDAVHINENGHKAVADYIFKVLVSNNFFQDMNFDYPPTPPLHTDTVYQRKISYPSQIFLKTKSWRSTRKNFAKKDFRSALLS